MKRSLQRAASTLSQTRPSSPSATFVCNRCRHQALQSPHASRAFHASPRAQEFTDKLRKKIWGTDNPPGPKDPYAPRDPYAPAEAAAEQQLESELPAASQQPHSAAIEDFANEEYVESKTWEGLERIGGPSGWWEEAWDEENQFRGFSNPKLSTKPIELTIKRALVEILTLQDAGQSINNATRGTNSTICNFNDVQVNYINGTPTVSFLYKKMRSNLLESMMNPTEESAEDESISSATTQKAQDESSVSQQSTNATDAQTLRTGKPTWFDLPIVGNAEMLKFKFVLIKRVMQLSGIRISDPIITKVQTVGDLVEELQVKPKPKKLADALLARPDLMALPNLEIFPHRHTPIDKEKEVGRWKVIEKALNERGLPVTGRPARPASSSSAQEQLA